MTGEGKRAGSAFGPPRFPFPWGRMGCRPGTLPQAARTCVYVPGDWGAASRPRRPSSQILPSPIGLMRGRQETCAYGNRL